MEWRATVGSPTPRVSALIYAVSYTQHDAVIARPAVFKTCGNDCLPSCAANTGQNKADYERVGQSRTVVPPDHTHFDIKARSRPCHIVVVLAPTLGGDPT